jgi:ribosomal protein S18 acetylase RimI-like enzyme
MSLVIASAAEEDDEQIWRILEPIFRAAETYCVPSDIDRAGGLSYWRGGTHEAFVAGEEGGPVIGSYFLCANQAGGGAHVANAGFATAPAARGRGVARQMLRHALATARARGFRAMQFNFVVSTNASAVALWASEGFETVGRLPRAFHHPGKGYVDALVMYRTL